MATDKQKCPVCKTHDAVINGNSEMHKVECPLCGHFRISRMQMRCESKIPVHVLSGVLRNTWETTGKEFDVCSYTVDSMESLRNTSPLPIPSDTDITAKADLVLRYIQRNTTYPGEYVVLYYEKLYSIAYCKTAQEFSYYVKHLISSGHINQTIVGGKSLVWSITPAGWTYLSGISAEAKDQGFIAMSFKPELKPVSDSGLYPGIANAGYKPLRIDSKDHNNRIDDEIVAEIRKSRFVVADLTGKNAGAYFEAGFAMGLNKPVIWTCQQSEIDAGNVHFDTRQYSIVSWEPDKLDDFAKRLTQRIEATIGRGTYVTETPN